MTLRRRRALLAGCALVPLLGCASENGDPGPSPTPTPTPGGSCSASPVSGTPALRLERVASSLNEPLDLQTPGDRARLFIVEQPGRIRLLRGGSVVGTPYLDITDRVGSSGSEQGLLGLAFHPRFSENGRFFVNYTDRGGDTHISEFRAGPTADTADPASERLLLLVDQPFANHNGGGMTFGPDGLLYIGLGDGGSGGDPFGNGQSLSTLLGKLLRIDVDGGAPYGVPTSNPFVGRAGARSEIWAFGLRNPWRFAFDRSTGDLFIGDVGQNRIEEIDVGLASRRGGENYGWNVTEGSQCFAPSSGCATGGQSLPVVEYTHSEGCSVTGGFVYRGCRMPGYAGTYFYGDFCTGFIRSFRFQNGQVVDARDWTSMLGRRQELSAFGIDAEGEIYVMELSGSVYKIVPAI